MPDIDSYIMKFEPEVQRRLMEIRFCALDIFQNVQEKIHYGMPSFVSMEEDIDGMHIMYYAGYKKHVAIHLGYNWKNDWEARGNILMDLLKSSYPQYGYTKFTVQILHKDEFPDEMIHEICELLWQDRKIYL